MLLHGVITLKSVTMYLAFHLVAKLFTLRTITPYKFPLMLVNFVCSLPNDQPSSFSLLVTKQFLKKNHNPAVSLILCHHLL